MDVKKFKSVIAEQFDFEGVQKNSCKTHTAVEFGEPSTSTPATDTTYR